MPEIFHPMVGFVSWLGGAFWMLMLVDCIFLNRSPRGSKGWWIFVLFIGNWIAAVFYFFLGPSFIFQKLQPLLLRFIKNTNWYPTQQPEAPTKQPEPIYTEYQQGYQASETPPQPEPVYTPDPLYTENQYEQPQASYPELPAQQQP